MENTIINELEIKGSVAEKEKEKEEKETQTNTCVSTEEKNKIVEECLDRVKEYLKYEYGR